MTPLSNDQQSLVYWIIERDNIRQAKLLDLSPPWTQNKVLAENYFCNINREDDKVTQWIRSNWICDEWNSDTLHLDMIVARVFNQPKTLEYIGQPSMLDFLHWLKESHDKLKIWEAEKMRIWNGAYIISTAGQKMSKLDYCINVFRNAYELSDLLCDVTTLQQAHTNLMQVNGLASFLAAQVVADLKRYPLHPLASAEDWWTFSSYGPGSLRGLCWFWNTTITPKNYQESIDKAYNRIKIHLPKSILKILDMQNFQNCLCEYDKFMRVTYNTGRSKRKYIAK